MILLNAMSLPHTSKDLNSCPSFLPPSLSKYSQKHQLLQYSNNLADFNNLNIKFLPKNSPKKILPKKFLPKNSSQKIPQKNSPKNSKQF